MKKIKLKRKSKNSQPIPQKGSIFSGWAVFNWGICYHKVFRTRKEAKEYCYKMVSGGESWDDVKDHMAVVKVKCIVQ